MNNSLISRVAGLSILALLPSLVHAQLKVTENFNGATLSDTSKSWSALNGACLTASTLNTTFTPSAPAINAIPGCVSSSGFNVSNGNSYYSSSKINSVLVGGTTGTSLPDAAGYGVLRLTNGASAASPTMSSTNGNNETGAFILNNPFPSNSGMNISFNTYTWGGNAYKNSSGVKSGADGIAFFLLDESKYANPSPGTPISSSSVIPVTKTGAYGGSLGYDCASNKYSGLDSSSGDGIIGAYIGLGIDEFGNFVNKGDNANGSEAASPGQTPNTIAIRGGGNVNTATFPTSGGLPTGSNPALGPIAQPQYVCQYGYYTTSATSSVTPVVSGSISGTPTLYSVTSATANAASPGATGNSVITWVSSVNTTNSTYVTTTGTYPVQGVFDYPILGYKTLAASNPIVSQESVTTPNRNAATPINYFINLTPAGLLSVSYSYNGGVFTPVLSNQNIVPSGGTLPPYFLFGFTSGTGGGSNNHEISCFNAVQLQSSASSAGSDIPQNFQVQAGNQIYLASYNPLYWTGTVVATDLNVAANGTVTIGNPVWDAGCVLSGAAPCTTTNTTNTAQASRAIATWNDGIAAGGTTVTTTTGAVALTAANFSKLSGNEQQMLNCGTPTGTGSSCDNLGQKRIGFLTDNNTSSSDAVTGSPFRARTSLLGDMINSSPVWVGAPSYSYGNLAVDNIQSGDTMVELTSYTTYQKNLSALNGGLGRLNTLYVGANDGMVHGFAAGYGDVTSTTSASDNSGIEVMAYVPSLPLTSIHDTVSGGGELDFTNQLYAHNDYVDATPGVGDLYWPGASRSNPSSIGTNWQTWLVGGLGGGGNLTGVIGGTVASGTITAATANNGVGEIYAINITNPITPANLNAASGAAVAGNVMGDWTTTSIVCDTVVGITDKCNLHLGSTYGTPTIRRLHSGNWGIIFGNGLNSADGTAGIFIIEVTGSGLTPTFVIHYIDTGVGPSSDPTGKSTVNGIAFATPADLDGDHITDYVYAGDVFGNVWRFDLTSSNPGSWGSPAQVFQASSASLLRPITTQVLVNTIPYNGSNGIVINFGTGRELQQTLTSAAGYAPDGQLLFGVWDWNMSVWNAKNSTQYYSMKAGTGITSGLTNLTSQTLSALTGTGAGTGYNVTANTVCYGFMSNCTGTPNPSYGWYLTLLNTQEQFLYNATLEDGFIFINSVIPPDQQKQSTSCTQLTATGYTYSLDAAAGTFSGQAAFSLNGVGTPFFVTSSPTGSGSSGGGGGPGTCTGPNCTTPPPTCTGANCTTTPTCTGGNSNITTLITQTQNGTGVAQQYSLCAGRSCACSPSARLTWLELR